MPRTIFKYDPQRNTDPHIADELDLVLLVPRVQRPLPGQLQALHTEQNRVKTDHTGFNVEVLYPPNKTGLNLRQAVCWGKKMSHDNLIKVYIQYFDILASRRCSRNNVVGSKP